MYIDDRRTYRSTSRAIQSRARLGCTRSRGWMKWFDGGTHVSYRPTINSDGSPVVEITVTSADPRIALYQKIHFREGTKQ